MDLKEVKKTLLAKQEELQGRITATQADEREETREAGPDSAKLWENSEIRDDLDDEASSELEQVNQALRRLESDDYGICTSCGKAIGEDRLEAVPYAAQCIDCAGREQS